MDERLLAEMNAKLGEIHGQIPGMARELRELKHAVREAPTRQEFRHLQQEVMDHGKAIRSLQRWRTGLASLWGGMAAVAVYFRDTVLHMLHLGGGRH